MGAQPKPMDSDQVLGRYRVWIAWYYSVLFALVGLPVAALGAYYVATPMTLSKLGVAGFFVVAVLGIWKWFVAGACIVHDSLLRRRRALYVSGNALIFICPALLSAPLAEIEAVSATPWKLHGRHGANIRLHMREGVIRTIYTSLLVENPSELLDRVRLIAARST